MRGKIILEHNLNGDINIYGDYYLSESINVKNSERIWGLCGHDE